TEDQHAGAKVQCPKCKGIIIVPGKRVAPVLHEAIATRKQEEEDYRLDREGGLSNRQRLGRARVGLALHWGNALSWLILSAASLLYFLVGLILLLVVLITHKPVPAGRSLFDIMGSLVGCLGLLHLFVTPILAAVGSLMCFWAPARSGVRVLSMV